MNKKLSYRQYKRRQRCIAAVLLLCMIFFVVLGFVIGRNSKDSYTIYQIPRDSQPSMDEVLSDENEHKCSNYIHQMYEEVVSRTDDSILDTSPCIEITDGSLEDNESLIDSSEAYIELTEQEKHELACLIYLEGRGESLECQKAIGSVVLNRYTTGNYASLHDVVHAPGQFTPACLIPETTPTTIQTAIVEDLAANGPSLPQYVTYFRANKYHTWETTEPYINIDNTYFSASKQLCDTLR